MELLAVLYTFLLVTICLLLALMLYRTAKPTANRDDAALKEWLRQQLDAQNQQMEAKLAEMSRQNLAAMGQISEALQSSVQSMSAALTAGQGTQQQTMEQQAGRNAPHPCRGHDRPAGPERPEAGRNSSYGG